MFGWLSRRAKAPAQAAASDAVERYNRGKLAYTRGAFAEAKRLLQQALDDGADFPDARAALFQILHAEGDRAGAAAHLKAALRHRPDWTEALYNYGTLQMSLGQDNEAEGALRRVLGLDPGFGLAYRMLGSLLHRQGRIEEMLELCVAGREQRPDDFDLQSFELFGLNFTESLSPQALFERHRQFGERLERMHAARFPFAREAASPERRLRIGYLSGDFSYHPVGLFTLPVLERHDHAAFEVYCYATSSESDDFTRRLAAAADVWRDVHALSDAQLADAVHQDRIDILVDLAGHSGVSRLGVFAQQPAPVQASWLGYLNTTGLTRIAHRISDRHCDPVDVTDRWHTEKLLRLPQSQWCYRPLVMLAHAPAPPLLRNGHVTFGSFNQVAKLSRTTRRLWQQILVDLPDSRLLIAGAARGPATDALRADFAAAGIAVERVTVRPFVPVKEYLALYDSVDMALDPTPYSGGTTTCDALWMGVPVLTLPGPRPASRSATSVLTSLELREWIAESAEDYVERAVKFAGSPKVLAALRTSLRERMRDSPLMDEQRFTRNLEDAYRQMWRSWCAGPA